MGLFGGWGVQLLFEFLQILFVMFAKDGIDGVGLQALEVEFVILDGFGPVFGVFVFVG